MKIQYLMASAVTLAMAAAGCTGGSSSSSSSSSGGTSSSSSSSSSSTGGSSSAAGSSSHASSAASGSGGTSASQASSAAQSSSAAATSSVSNASSTGTASSTASTSSGGIGACTSANYSDGTALPPSPTTTTLGTLTSGTVCYDPDFVGTQYAYWKITGPFLDTDRFTMTLTLHNGAAGDTVDCFVGGAGTYLPSDYGPSVTDTAPTATTMDINGLDSGGNPDVYVLCNATTTGTSTSSLSIDFTLTKQ